MKAKKFITTDTHPELKQGLTIIPSHGNTFKDEIYCGSTVGEWFANDFHIKKSLEKGHIKELQEPEFTPADMIKFAEDWEYYHQFKPLAIVEDFFDNWIKQENK